MHRDMPHQKHKQQRAQQMPPKRHQHPPAARQRPSLDQELYAADCRAKAALPARRSNPQRPNLKRSFYAASCKPRTTNPAPIHAAPRTAPTPHAVTVAAKMAVAGTAKTKAATAPTERHMHMHMPPHDPTRARTLAVGSTLPLASPERQTRPGYTLPRALRAPSGLSSIPAQACHRLRSRTRNAQTLAASSTLPLAWLARQPPPGDPVRKPQTSVGIHTLPPARSTR